MAKTEEGTSNNGLLRHVTSGAQPLPERIVLHGLEGSGKSSFGAFAEKPVFICTRGETGLNTLIRSKRVPETPHFPELTSWARLLGVIEALRIEPHDYKNLVLDTANGAEALLAEHVLQEEFSGSTQTFASYGKGNLTILSHWRNFILSLDSLRQQRGIGIVLLIHSVKKPFSDPKTGGEYDRWEPSLTTKYQSATSWGVVNAFADVVLFLAFDDEVIENRKTGEQRINNDVSLRRVLYTERRPAWDAKNRFGMPPKIILGDDPADAWEQIREYLPK